MPASRNSRVMKNIAITLLIGLFVSLSAFAQQQVRKTTVTTEKTSYLYANAYRNEIEASTTYGELSSANSLTVVQASATYKYMIVKALQAGVKLDILMTSGSGNNNTYLGLWGIFAYDFNQSWNNSDSFFGEVAAGLVDTALAGPTSSTTTASDKKFSYMITLGKNIPLWDRIKFSPKGGVRKIGDTDMQIILIPLNLTIAF